MKIYANCVNCHERIYTPASVLAENFHEKKRDDLAYTIGHLPSNIQAVSFPSPRSGGRRRYICRECARVLFDYTAENARRIGNEKANGRSYSVEWETTASTLCARGLLYLEGAFPSADCTVDTEYKSAIHNGFNSLSAFLPSIEKMLENGEIEIDERRCGTHLHIGKRGILADDNRCPETPAMRALRRCNNSLFLPLSRAISETTEEARRAFWGRDFGEWAEAYTERTSADEHAVFINLQHNATIEWRLPLFRSAKQYAAVCRFCTAATEIFLEWAVKEYGEGIDNTTNKIRARRAGEKAAEKYREMLREYLRA